MKQTTITTLTILILIGLISWLIIHLSTKHEVIDETVIEPEQTLIVEYDRFAPIVFGELANNLTMNQFEDYINWSDQQLATGAAWTFLCTNLDRVSATRDGDYFLEVSINNQISRRYVLVTNDESMRAYKDGQQGVVVTLGADIKFFDGDDFVRACGMRS